MSRFSSEIQIHIGSCDLRSTFAKPFIVSSVALCQWEHPVLVMNLSPFICFSFKLRSRQSQRRLRWWSRMSTPPLWTVWLLTLPRSLSTSSKSPCSSKVAWTFWVRKQSKTLRLNRGGLMKFCCHANGSVRLHDGASSSVWIAAYPFYCLSILAC